MNDKLIIESQVEQTKQKPCKLCNGLGVVVTRVGFEYNFDQCSGCDIQAMPRHKPPSPYVDAAEFMYEEQVKQFKLDCPGKELEIYK